MTKCFSKIFPSMLFLSVLIMVSVSFSTGVKVMEDGETRLDINVLKGGIVYRISAASNSTVLVFEQMEGSFRFRVFGNAGDAGYLRIVQPVGLNSSSIKVFSNNSRLVFPSTDPPRSIASNAFGRPIDPYTDLLAEADKTYYIRIAGDRLSTGTFNLTVSYERDPLPNDDISNAIPLIVNQPEDGTTIGATGVEMSSCLWRDFYDIWYSFTPRHGGTYTFTLENTDFDAGATVYRLEYFEWLGTFEIETCINPWADQPATFQAIAGVTYYIRIAGDYFTKGNFTITCKKQFTADMNDDGKVDLNDQEQLLNHWLDSNCQSSNWCDGADLDFSGKVDLGDYVIFVRNWLEGTGP